MFHFLTRFNYKWLRQLSRLIKFIDEKYDSWDQVLFWPDLATCHYKKENLDFLRDNGIAFVEKIDNPPNAPQIRPFENYLGILKMKVYDPWWMMKKFDRNKKIRLQHFHEFFYKIGKNRKQKYLCFVS